MSDTFRGRLACWWLAGSDQLLCAEHRRTGGNRPSSALRPCFLYDPKGVELFGEAPVQGLAGVAGKSADPSRDCQMHE